MKYWRGYLTAAILLACTWALRGFVKAHSVLVDMVYPYVTRMAQAVLANWSSGVDFCVWQMLLLALIALITASGVAVIILKWNPIRWFGWVCTVVAALVFLNTCLYGLNEFSGPLSEDIRLEETDYTISELEKATVYFRDKANALAGQIGRKESDMEIADAELADFETLAQQAVSGYEELVYGQSLSVFAGPMEPVKKLGWAGRYTAQGTTGVTVGLTGEACVNPDTPTVLLPFAMCREMAKRSSITVERDAAFGAFLACINNEETAFQYSGYLMAYRYCLKALQELDVVTGAGAAAGVISGEEKLVSYDLLGCDKFCGKMSDEEAQTCELLTSWHIQEIVLPSQVVEDNLFDPMDKTQVDLSDHPNA